MPRRVHSRIQADEGDAEERELQRLEGRGAGGSTGSDARLRRESGGNLQQASANPELAEQQHGERAATGEGGRPDRRPRICCRAVLIAASFPSEMLPSSTAMPLPWSRWTRAT